MRTLVHGTLVFWLNVAAPCVGGQLLPFVLATSVHLVLGVSVFYFGFGFILKKESTFLVGNNENIFLNRMKKNNLLK